MDEDSSQDGTCKLSFDDVRCDRTGNIEMINIKEDTTSVKDEPMSDQEYVETSSCPPSPCSASDDTPRHYGKVILKDRSSIVIGLNRFFLPDLLMYSENKPFIFMNITTFFNLNKNFIE